MVLRPGARRRLEAFDAHAAVVYGSGLAALPSGAMVVDELGYEELGWPCTAVPGHANVVRLVWCPAPGDVSLRLALACGRPHRYEGWPDVELERPVVELAAAGVTRIVLTNSTGWLRPAVAPGDVVVCRQVVDLQTPPPGGEAARLAVCSPGEAAAVAGALTTAATRSVAGVYVAVCGPQFETPAEVAWLSGYGDVVGMSAAPEVRAAQAAGAMCCLLALVVNRAAEVGSHDEVLARGARVAHDLSTGIGAALLARWPGLA